MTRAKGLNMPWSTFCDITYVLFMSRFICFYVMSSVFHFCIHLQITNCNMYNSFFSLISQISFEEVVQPCCSICCSVQKVRATKATNLFVVLSLFADCMTKISLHIILSNWGRPFYNILACLPSWETNLEIWPKINHFLLWLLVLRILILILCGQICL